MMWIELHDGKGRKRMVNADHISAIDETTDKEDKVDGSLLYLHGVSGVFVKETPEEIMRMMKIKPC